jgi:hypothetical protein
VQIPLYTKETLSEYYEKVKGEKRDIFSILELFLDVYSSCPICGGKDCARFFKYYTREVVDENGKFYKDFPIAQFICNRKGNNIKVGHKTFSLLPYQLIPYRKYSIYFTIESCKSRNKEGKSINGVLDHLAGIAEDDLSINGNQILRMDTLIEEAIDKILASGYYPEFDTTLHQHSSGEGRIKNFIEYAEGFECLKGICDIKGPCALGYDFYLSGGGYYKNAHFLFGTASQFRLRGG